MKSHRFAFAMIALALANCASVPPGVVPCFDGWTTDDSGPSRLWTPSTAEKGRLAALLEPQERLACVHRMPSGKLILITRDAGRTRTAEVRASGDGFELMDRGSVVGPGH
jgi:hypothetical protein